MATEIVEYLFRFGDTDQADRALARVASASEKTAKRVDDLTMALKRQKHASDGATRSNRKFDGSIKAVRGSGQLFGGVIGQITGAIDDMADAGEGAAEALGPAGIAGVLGILGAIAVPVVLGKMVSLSIDLARAAVQARDRLIELGDLDLLSKATIASLDKLETELKRADSAVARLTATVGAASTPAVSAYANVLSRLANLSESPLLQQLSEQITPQTIGATVAGLGVTALSGPFLGTIAAYLGGSLAAPLAPEEQPYQFVGPMPPENSGAPQPPKANTRQKAAPTPPIGDNGYVTLQRIVASMQQVSADINDGFTYYGRTNEELTAELRADREAALRESIAAGATGGKAVGTRLVQQALSKVPIIGDMLAGMLDILTGLPAFAEALVDTIATLPGQIIGGLGDLVGNLGDLLLDNLAPNLIAGFVGGVASLIASPYQLLAGLPDLLVNLPARLGGALADALHPNRIGALEKTARLQTRIEQVTTAVIDSNHDAGVPGYQAGGMRTHGTTVRVAEEEPEVVMPARKAGLFPRYGDVPALHPTFVGVGPDTADQLLTLLRLRQGFTGNGLQGF